MINKPLPSKDLNVRIPIVIPIQGREFINLGSTIHMIYRTVHGKIFA